MQDYKFEQKRLENIEINNKELIILNIMFLDINYPYNFLILKEIAAILKCSKRTAIRVMESLIRKKCIEKCSDFINFYYPIKDVELRNTVLERLGFK